MVKAIIFDCFGVLYRGSLDYLYEITPTESHRQLRDLSRASDYGYVDREEYMSTLVDLTGHPRSEINEVTSTRHIRNQPLFDLIEELKPDYKIGLLSNIGRNAIDELFSLDEQAEMFDAIVLSSEIGAIKPSQAAYLAAARMLDESPQSCLMVDDMPSNIEGARAVDMQGVVFYSTKQFASELETIESKHA